MSTPTVTMLYLCIMAIILATSAVYPTNGLANCPLGCNCNDETLVVQCGAALNHPPLDVLPIALNPSLQRLVIKNNKIKTIDSSIQFYAELTYLDLSFNHLYNIPQRTFGYQRKLQELHLDHNKIGAINNGTFIGLNSLTVLIMRQNFLDELEDGVFSQLGHLEELNLGENRIKKIAPNAFSGLVNLRSLYLDDNLLTVIPTATFPSMPSLAELYLGSNSFATLQRGAFGNLKGLSRLDLRGAGIHNVSQGALKDLDNLRLLDLSDNHLRQIPTGELSLLTKLEELSLGQNDFEIIPEGAFAGMMNLKKLTIVSAGYLRTIEKGAFSSNTNLESLTISSNKMLENVQDGALSGLPHLKHLVMKSNAIKTLGEGLFTWNELNTLDLSENPIVCDCEVLWLRNLLVAKNATNEMLVNVICGAPKHLHDKALTSLSAETLGCSSTNVQKQTMIGLLLVGSAAILTVLILLLYKCRRKIREALKGGWGNSALVRKEREYQKTFSDEDYMSRHPHPCSIGIHPTMSSFPHHTHPELRPIPVTEL